MNTLPELPPNLTLAQLQELINDRIRQLNLDLSDTVESPASATFDMGNNRIVALADPQGDLDAVNLRTLKRFPPGAGAALPAATAAGVQAYAMVFDKDAALVDGETIPAYIVAKDRDGGPQEASLYSRIAAPSDVSINFGVILPVLPIKIIPLLVNKRPDNNGNINPLDLLLPAGQMGPVFFVDGGPVTAGGAAIVRGFGVKSFPHGTVVFPTITAGSSATMCTMEVMVRRGFKAPQ